MTPEEALDTATALPCWNGTVDGKPLEGGITNHNILVQTDEGKFVVRLGQDIPEHGVMRWHELAASKAANAAGISPGVFYHRQGVLVLEYVESRALEETDLHQPEVLLSVVDLVRQAHKNVTMEMRGNVLSFWIFHVLRDYAGTLRDNGSAYIPKLGKLLEQADLLENAVGPVNLVFGHNDLLPANILDDGERYWLIDWEYAGFNSPLFDLGGLASNCGLDRQAEAKMLRAYFGNEPDNDLWRRYDAMKCASLLRETMWSMVSEITSELDFDYSQYTEKNLDRYEEAIAGFFAKGSGK
ncbi:MAG: phosphotransferase [Rhizobiaceae bacterium]